MPTLKQNSWTVTAVTDTGTEETFETKQGDWYGATQEAMDWAKTNGWQITKIEQAGVTVGSGTVGSGGQTT